MVSVNKSKVLNWYYSATGGVDSGLDIDTALSRMQMTGMADAGGKSHVFGPHGAIDYTNQTEVMQALYLFKGVDIGVDAGPLENVVRPQQNGWVLTGVERAGETNHSIMAAGYGTLQWVMNLLNCPAPPNVNPDEFGFVGYTWSAWGFIGASSLPKIAGEMWAIVTDPDRGDAATWERIATTDYQEITGGTVNPAPSPQPQPAPTHRSAVLMERMSKKYGVPAERILNEFRGWVERYHAGDQQAALAELAKLEAEFPQ